MKRYYEFQCTEHGVFEEYTEYAKEHPCPACGKSADKIISTPHIKLEGVSGDFPGASMKFEKIHREKLKQEQKLTS
jgi:putative FmdB family regulatory protein